MRYVTSRWERNQASVMRYVGTIQVGTVYRHPPLSGTHHSVGHLRLSSWRSPGPLRTLLINDRMLYDN